jgi:glyoxylase-like metal-dependent hydrolase (beta-lactamase superfamily II)
MADPWRDVAEYLDTAAAAGLRVESVIETHVHANFLSGHLELAAATGGEPPYLVRSDDGRTTLVFPGPDAIIEHPRRKARKGSARG